MIKAAIIASFCLLAATLPSLSQDPTSTATQEGIRRQYNTMVLRDTLKKADDALAKNDLAAAAKLYDASWDLILSIGPGVEAETRHTQQGIAAARMPLAMDAQKRGDYRQADREVNDVVRIDPNNQNAIIFKKGNDEILGATWHKNPTPDVVAKVQYYEERRKTNDTVVQDARLLFEAGHVTEAEAKLDAALREDPNNNAARYYLNLISNERFQRSVRDKEVVA